MAGHLDLGDDGDAAGGRVGDDLADLGLGVEAAVGRRLAFLLRRRGRSRACPPGRRARPRLRSAAGYFLISIRQPWSSVRCQWKVFILCMARSSRSVLTKSVGKKWRLTSRSMPRQAKRGLSAMRTAGTVQAGAPRGPGGRRLFRKDRGREKLEEGLDAVEESGRVTRFDRDVRTGNAVKTYPSAGGLGPETARKMTDLRKGQRAPRRAAIRRRRDRGPRRPEPGGEESGRALRPFVSGRDEDLRRHR